MSRQPGQAATSYLDSSALVKRYVVDEAIDLTAKHRLRSYDAVHLACALTINRALVAYSLPPLVFVSSDSDLLKAAEAEGLATDDPNRHP